MGREESLQRWREFRSSPQWGAMKAKLVAYQQRAINDIRKHAKENDTLNGYYAGLLDAYLIAQDIPEMIIQDLEGSLTDKPEDEESS